MRFATIVLCITALMMIGGMALATESRAFDTGTEPYQHTGDHDGIWRWYVDPGDYAGGTDGYAGSHTVGERDTTYGYAWGDGFEDWWFYYNWETNTWDEGTTSGHGHTGNYALQIDADIELYVNEGMERNLVYFHRIANEQSIKAEWGYWLEANHGCWVFLTVDDGCNWGGLNSGKEPYLDQVSRHVYNWDEIATHPTDRKWDTKDDAPDMSAEYYVDNSSTGTNRGGTTHDVVIPIDFYMWAKAPGTEAGTWVKGTYSASGCGGNLKGITFDPAKTGILKNPGYMSTKFRATLKPHKYQPDGRYMLDPVVEVGPDI
jgi:hypothetical protein